ncbi:MAG: putative major facilitator superfamily transporter [Gammaproteobacteria bacterium]|jgi:MFS family permease|nr:putative major facilitator superfamily transporter [Gammaproteobacteria bacterium]
MDRKIPMSGSMQALVTKFKQVSTDYYLMLIAMFLMKTGQFMLLPFLAIFLIKTAHISPSEIGLVIGSGAFVYGAFSLAAGVLTDRLGVKKVLITALLLGSISLFFFFSIRNVAWYIAMNVLTGISRSLFNVGGKSYGVEGLSFEMRRFCFSLRSMATNSGASVGPLFGAYFAIHSNLLVFPVIGMLYLALGVLCLLILKNCVKDMDKKPVTVGEAMGVLRKDTLLQLLMLITFVYWLTYSQFDSTLPQYLALSLHNGVHIYTAMFVVSAVGCAGLQVITTHLTRNCSEGALSYSGMVLFAIAYVLIALFLQVPALIIASVFLVFAEIIVIPVNDLLTAKIAPENRIGTYYGAISLATVGMGIGPMLGGYIYQHLGVKAVFLSCAVLCLMTIVLYKKLIDLIMAA